MVMLDVLYIRALKSIFNGIGSRWAHLMIVINHGITKRSIRCQQHAAVIGRDRTRVEYCLSVQGRLGSAAEQVRSEPRVLEIFSRTSSILLVRLEKDTAVWSRCIERRKGFTKGFVFWLRQLL